jgi:hypothetical protein
MKMNNLFEINRVPDVILSFSTRHQAFCNAWGAA